MEKNKPREKFKATGMEVFIKDPELLEQKKDIFKRAGLNNIHILADFDRTLTYGSVDGVKTPSIISMLRDGQHLSEEYAKQAHALYDKYHVFENDPKLSLEERKKMMSEWWHVHNKLLIESGLSKADLQDIVDHGHVRFREGVEDFLDSINEKNIPMVIMSASGCGDAIKMFFEKIGKEYKNIHYITNQFNWDENGKAVSTKEPVIHSLNKSEIVLSDAPAIYDAVKDRKNVILLGDSLGDLEMVNGFEYDNLMSIGFQNDKRDKAGEEYENRFDVVLKGDGGFEYVGELVNNLK